ncbi:DEAD/DEAH box helicase [Oesophagostomum dentatum]|uniref:ATP-dependent RNA helicase n=1 Tax=Oesophagostomum dentatum TaxID=61180 RepID=A0A0B1RRJ2_OESDE|nr:DEAD/DEAH box helicase [Oesophagostomum dentatum]
MFSLALEDKNIMARARTGSGKTGAYLIPIIQKCIAYSEDRGREIAFSPTFDLFLELLRSEPEEPQGPSALFIAPTKELCVQINDLLVKLLQPLPFLRSLNLSDLTSEEKSVWEHDFANLVITTPGKLLEMLAARPKFCNDVRHLVLDEADLLLSFGYEEEMK